MYPLKVQKPQLLVSSPRKGVLDQTLGKGSVTTERQAGVDPLKDTVWWFAHQTTLPTFIFDPTINMSSWEQKLEGDVQGLEPTSTKQGLEEGAVAAGVAGIAYEGYEYEQKRKAEQAAAQANQTDQTDLSNN